ncbi:glycoside hydrolase family 13 protein [Lacimicrobium sp. SS2-24]|uniref:glycoside hydrolase family 13 protein n=1 Tax=Lacimicrobium sp. SS2-24 TaxID=2005569 RepID=UPI001FF06E5A|nr:glycoside hydrolase family 13 protein [Lacimicrobium sp. SS2-24]
MFRVIRYLSLVCFVLLKSTQVQAYQLERVEPLFWWTGMQHPTLQLMISGQDIGQLSADIDYPGVKVTGVQPADSDNYLFIDLHLSPDTKPGVMQIKFTDEQGMSVLSSDYQLKAREPGSAQRQGMTPADVIYLITPDRFANGDIQNDNQASLKEKANRDYKGGRHGGDIQGMIDHLDYLQDLGITQLWLNPVLENDMPSYSYHGYSTTDYYGVDPRFGSNALYAELAEQAKQRGMGLIKDIILNHIGSEHPWMQDLPFTDWLNYQDEHLAGEFIGTTHRREARHDPHGTEYDKQRFADGWFVPTMPDLNQQNPFVANYLIQNSIWWVEYAGLSGIRLDTYSYPDKNFLTEYGRRLMLEYPKLGIVGEEWTTNPALVAYWQRGAQRHDDYQSHTPNMFDFPLQQAVVNGLVNDESWGTGLREIYLSLANDFMYADPYALVIMPDNHDMSRIYTQLNEDPKLFEMAMVLFATTRGIPQFFYGFEILMANPDSDDHGIIRSDFPGGWPGDGVNGFSGKGLSARQTEAQQFVRKLLNWRKTADAVHRGKLTHYAPDQGYYTYFRQTEQQTLMVVINKNDAAVRIDSTPYYEVIQGLNEATDVLNGGTQMLEALTVPARSATIFELNQ